MKATFTKLELHFKRPVGTSRGIMNIKNSWILKLTKDEITGVGEISIIEGLSPDFENSESFEKKIQEVCVEYFNRTSYLVMYWSVGYVFKRIWRIEEYNWVGARMAVRGGASLQLQ